MREPHEQMEEHYNQPTQEQIDERLEDELEAADRECDFRRDEKYKCR